jgi:hypothetical protein
LQHKLSFTKAANVADTYIKVRLFRDRAAELRESAQSSPTLEGRDAYLRLAEKWSQVADEIERTAEGLK